MQLEFRCPECGVSGLTPEITEQDAIAVALKELSIWCPCCSAIIEVTEPLGRVMWKTQTQFPVALAEKAAESLSLLVRQALKAKLEGRAAKPERSGPVHGQQDAPAGRSQPSR